MEPRYAATRVPDPDAADFIRFCYAGSNAEMHEAVERIGTWLHERG